MSISVYPHFTGDPYKKSFDFIDLILKLAPENDSFEYPELISESNISQIEKDIARHISDNLRLLIIKDLKYIESLPNDVWKQRLTSLGRSVKKAGGHLAYLEKQENNATADAVRQKRKDIIDEADAKIKPWTFRKRYLPYLIPSLALIGPIISIFISLKALKNNKSKQEMQLMQQKIQELKLQMNKQDSLFRADTLWKKRILIK